MFWTVTQIKRHLFYCNLSCCPCLSCIYGRSAYIHGRSDLDLQMWYFKAWVIHLLHSIETITMLFPILERYSIPIKQRNCRHFFRQSIDTLLLRLILFTIILSNDLHKFWTNLQNLLRRMRCSRICLNFRTRLCGTGFITQRCCVVHFWCPVPHRQPPEQSFSWATPSEADEEEAVEMSYRTHVLQDASFSTTPGLFYRLLPPTPSPSPVSSDRGWLGWHVMLPAYWHTRNTWRSWEGTRQGAQGTERYGAQGTDRPVRHAPLPSLPHLLLCNTWKPVWVCKSSVLQKRPIFVLQKYRFYFVGFFRTIKNPKKDIKKESPSTRFHGSERGDGRKPTL